MRLRRTAVSTAVSTAVGAAPRVRPRAPAKAAILLGAASALGIARAQAPPAGVENVQRAWQNWTLNCQGCHRPDGSGSATTAPSLAGTVARFLGVPGGREYLGRVPGVATSPLSNSDLAELMNWMLWRFDPAHLQTDFRPYTADEIGRLRVQPLRLEAAALREALLKKADALPDKADAPVAGKE